MPRFHQRQCPVRLSGTTAKFVGRVVVICLDIDYGHMLQITDGIITKVGNPISQQLEVPAINVALEEIPKVTGRDQEYVVFSDNIQAVESVKSERVKFLPVGEFHPVSAFLDRIMKRAQYLRSSSRKVTSRAPLSAIQKEIYEYFQAKQTVFKLSESLVWNPIWQYYYSSLKMVSRNEGSCLCPKAERE